MILTKYSHFDTPTGGRPGGRPVAKCNIKLELGNLVGKLKFDWSEKGGQHKSLTKWEKIQEKKEKGNQAGAELCQARGMLGYPAIQLDLVP